MEMHGKGTPVREIRNAIDAKYAKVGKPMATPRP
jgi:hypothetical protein